MENLARYTCPPLEDCPCFFLSGENDLHPGRIKGRLSMDFGLKEFGVMNKKDRLSHYRRFVYDKGGLTRQGEERRTGIELKAVERFRYRTRYFTDSGIIGTKDFVERVYI